MLEYSQRVNMRAWHVSFHFHQSRRQTFPIAIVVVAKFCVEFSNKILSSVVLLNYVQNSFCLIDTSLLQAPFHHQQDKKNFKKISLALYKISVCKHNAQILIPILRLKRLFVWECGTETAKKVAFIRHRSKKLAYSSLSYQLKFLPSTLSSRNDNKLQIFKPY